MHSPDAAIRLLCLPLSRAASLPAVPERPLQAMPAVGALSSERLRLRLRLCLSACVARKAAPLHACRRAPHIRVRLSPLHGRCCSSTAIATSAEVQLSYLTASLLLEDYKPPTLYNSVSKLLQQLIYAGRRPAAESAHNMTLQLSVCLYVVSPAGASQKSLPNRLIINKTVDILG